MPLPTLVFWSVVAVWVAQSLAMARMPIHFARWALVPGPKAGPVPLPPAAAARLLHPTEGKASYRDAPPRALALASLPGEERVARSEEDLHFVADRNWVVVRHRKLLSTSLVRVEVSATEGGLVLHARRFPDEATLLLLATAYMASLRGPLLHHPFSLLLLAAFIAGGLIGGQNRARRALDAVVDEMNKRLATLDPSYVPPPTPAQVAAAQGLTWTCGCGKVNDRDRSTCRRCWAAKP